MVAQAARQGRNLQRFTRTGLRLVVGCIPYKFEEDIRMEPIGQSLQVLVICSQKGQELMFPKGGWEIDESIRDAVHREAMEEAGVKGVIERILGKWRYMGKADKSYKYGFMYPLNVKEELLQEACKQPWMREALDRLQRRLTGGTAANSPCTAIAKMCTSERSAP
ncbi:unnamed protein product [Spirodela intermedia]|uniref:Nudix hydrolase domain-containing protein n=1 Tax=Spirodela intermedia TaxID=51605 RepID=A0A7I8J2C3_SPIIN|nr:unnamed protein product [Spirodela intermedia]CAA6664287.1 unnamed protein product [Spirodela intermedia]